MVRPAMGAMMRVVSGVMNDDLRQNCCCPGANTKH